MAYRSPASYYISFHHYIYMYIYIFIYIYTYIFAMNPQILSAYHKKTTFKPGLEIHKTHYRPPRRIHRHLKAKKSPPLMC